MRRVRDEGAKTEGHILRSSVPHVLLPIATGALIYLSWRSPTLLVFQWMRSCGMSALLADWRCVVAPARPAVHGWLLFSLPDALWAYAMTACMLLIWRARRPWLAWLWITTGAALGCGGELLQQFRVVPGTYDPTDLCLSLAAAFVAYFLLTRKFKTQAEDEPCANT